MQSEDAVAVEERYLWLEGRASDKVKKILGRGLPRTLPPDTEIFFVGYSYADIPLGKTFTVAFPKGKPLESVKCTSRIIAVTQQFGKSFNEIPHDWKTICAIQFPAGIPSFVLALPVADSWHTNSLQICLSTPETVAILSATAVLPKLQS